MTAIKELTDTTFKAEALCKNLAVIDFWSPSCPPCIVIGKHLQELAPNYKGRMTIFKVNADECPETAADYGVRGLPTLVLLKDGKQVASQIGSISPMKLRALLETWTSYE